VQQLYLILAEIDKRVNNFTLYCEWERCIRRDWLQFAGQVVKNQATDQAGGNR
jgi:hypothetical protein